MKTIGITGGIGSGKTTVCRVFETLGIPIFYADDEAKLILFKDKIVKSNIKKILGNDSFYKNGKPNRQYISSKIFTDKLLLNQINGIVHPAVHLAFEQWLAKQKKSNEAHYVIKEAALLVENGSYLQLDGLIVVTCPEEIRIQRVMNRDKLCREDVIKKIKNQLPEESKIKVANYIISNDGEQSVVSQVWKIHHTLNHIK